MNSSSDSPHVSNLATHVCTSICPSLEFLNNEKIVTNVVCTVPNCDEVFLNQSNLNFHLDKVHKVKLEKPANELVLTRAKSKSQKLLENCSCKYYCPVENCKFYFGSDKYLPTFHSLKNHFIRIHGVKTFSCSKCQRSFSIKSEMERHEESCGVVFKCSCGCPYASRLSLLKHARKKKHTLIDEPKIDVSNKVKKKDDIEPMIEAKRQKVKILPKMVDSQSHVFLIPLAVNSANTSTSLESCQVDLECQNDQRSLGCQTIFQDVTNETQEIACQTIYNNLIEVTKTAAQSTFDNPQSSYYTNASTSTHTDTSTDSFNQYDTRLPSSYQSQKTQTLSAQMENDAYMNMIIADISTQTQSPSFATGYSQTIEKTFYPDNSIKQSIPIESATENREIQTAEIGQNTTCTQTSQTSYCNQSREHSAGLNLEFTALDESVYFGPDMTNSGNQTNATSWNQVGTQYSVSPNVIDFMSQTNMEFPGVASSCQTDELYFTDSFSNTNSIQTQTKAFYGDFNGIDSITQTDQSLLFGLDKNL